MSITKRLNEAMMTRTTAPTEEYETKTNRNIIAESVHESKDIPTMANVPRLPVLPSDTRILKQLDAELFKELEPDFAITGNLPHINDLNEFIALFPETYRYSIQEQKGSKNRTIVRAQVLHQKDPNDPDSITIPISKVPYIHHQKTRNLDDSNDGCLILAFRDNELINLLLPMEVVAEPQKLIKALASKGILVNKGSDNREYIYEQNLNCKSIRFLTNRLGFRELDKKLCYVYSKGKGIGADIYYSQQDPQLSYALDIKGDSKKWIKDVLLPLNLRDDRPTVPFLLFSSLMPLFSSIIPEFQGIVINIIPSGEEKLTSSTGKTTLQRAMLSMQGSQEWMISWNTTVNAIESKLHSGFGAYLDDLSTGNIKNMEKVVYDNANGTQRARLNQDGTPKEVKHRKSVIFSSGEQPMLDLDSVKDGALVRAIDIELKTSDFGSDDPLLTKDIADSIKAAVYRHYGFIYRILVTMIIKQPDILVKQVEHYKSHFTSMTKDPLCRRLALHYAIIAVCGELLILATQKISGDETLLSSLNPLHAVSVMYAKQMRMINARDDRHLMALDIIKQSITIVGVDITDQFNHMIGVADGDISYIKSTEVNKILKELDNVVPKRFFLWAKAKGFLAETDSEEGRFTKTRRVGGSTVNTYAFNFNVKK